MIGTGGADLYAAVRAGDKDVRVTIWDKRIVGQSGGTVGGARVTAVGPWSITGDSPDVYLRDTLVGGSYLSEQALVRILVQEF